MSKVKNPDGIYDIGPFEVSSGELMVVDPCYTPDSEGLIRNAKNGTWETQVRIENVSGWGQRVAELMAVCVGTRDEAWHPAMFDVDVDSGQVGIIDAPEFKGGEDDEFYDDVMSKTLNSELHAGILNSRRGVVSSSGFGDGGYDCFYGKNEDGQITSVRVVFIPEAVVCSECENEVDEHGWSENDMIDGMCPSCRGRVQCSLCNNWVHEDEMTSDTECSSCVPRESEYCPNCDEHRETTCRCGWVEGQTLEEKP